MDEYHSTWDNCPDGIYHYPQSRKDTMVIAKLDKKFFVVRHPKVPTGTRITVTLQNVYTLLEPPHEKETNE